MPKKLYPHDLLAQTKLVLAGLAEVDQIHDVEAQLNRLKIQLANLQNQRESLYVSVWDRVKRIRFGVKALYGDDSSEYELVGGTRLSERKPWTRRQVQK